MFTRTAIAGAIMAGALLFAGVADASPYSGPTVSVDDPTPAPKQSIVVTLSGYQPGETINITNSCGSPTTVIADGAGTASFTVTAPETAGTCTITGTGQTSGLSDSVEFTVDASALPVVGSESKNLLATSAQVTVAGIGLVGLAVMVRRRRANI